MQKLPQADQETTLKELIKSDLFFLLVYVLNRKDADNDWIFERCREVQANPNGYLDLWARMHYKSTIITFALTIFDILNNPEITIGIFSHTRPMAKNFLRQIKHEFEVNQMLKDLFPEIFYQDPHKESPKWSEDEGIVVKRQSNPKEATIEASGLVDGQPIGKHYYLRIYDDMLTDKSITETLMPKTTRSWELSAALGTKGGIERYVGTRYHFNDTYKVMMERGVVKPRLYPATEDGSLDCSKAVFMDADELQKWQQTMGSYTFSCQMLQNPVADTSMGFRREWLRYYDNVEPSKLNLYIICDPANSKKATSDYTAVAVIGLGEDENYYLVDLYRDRLNLQERTELIINLHRKYKPLAVGYEKYGKDADISHIEYMQGREGYRFDIIPLGGKMAKNDRIRRLMPIFESGKFYFPRRLIKTNYQKAIIDVIDELIEQEYMPFPVGIHDDLLDSMARILDNELDARFPASRLTQQSIVNDLMNGSFF